MALPIIYTPKAAKFPEAYIQAVQAVGFIFVSGTAPADLATSAIIGTTIRNRLASA